MSARGEAAPPPFITPIDGTAAKAGRDNAEEFNAQGLTASRAGKLEEAEALFERAFALKKTHDIAANLGLVELKLGKASEAAEHMAFALRNSPPSDSDEMRKRIRQRLEEALSFAGTLRVKAGVGGAEIVIDGKVVGTEPLEGEVFVVRHDEREGRERRDKGQPGRGRWRRRSIWRGRGLGACTRAPRRLRRRWRCQMGSRSTEGCAAQAVGSKGIGGTGDTGGGCEPGSVGALGTAGTPGLGATGFGALNVSGYMGMSGEAGSPGSPGQGDGQNGGVGGTGGTGGSAAAGTLPACDGGKGGVGGFGGKGGGGQGGHALGIAYKGAAPPSTGVTIKTGTAGAGGVGEGATGSGAAGVKAATQEFP